MKQLYIYDASVQSSTLKRRKNRVFNIFWNNGLVIIVHIFFNFDAESTIGDTTERFVAKDGKFFRISFAYFSNETLKCFCAFTEQFSSPSINLHDGDNKLRNVYK